MPLRWRLQGIGLSTTLVLVVEVLGRRKNLKKQLFKIPSSEAGSELILTTKNRNEIGASAPPPGRMWVCFRGIPGSSQSTGMAGVLSCEGLGRLVLLKMAAGSLLLFFLVSSLGIFALVTTSLVVSSRIS